MAEFRRIWPLLVYGGLGAIAAVRRKETRANTRGRGAMRRSASLTGHSLSRARSEQRESY